MNAALFLDRDGVIIENRPDYVRSWNDVLIFPESIEAILKIKKSDYKIVIITNQSAVGRGLISLQTARHINSCLVEKIETAGGRIDGVFMCPHAPEDNCSCRKPQPGLIQQAKSALNLDLSRSILVGDALSDLLAGQTAGVGKNVLVRTGRGAAQASLSQVSQVTSFLIFDDLAKALQELIPITQD
jgi:D-glycero-D-manno-heptose 1,7-bisphosphate phosphatase